MNKNIDDPIVIVSAARTPIGAMLGQFTAVPSPNLGAAAIQACLDRAKLDPGQVDEVMMGCVLSAGLGQAPARQAALKAKLPESTPCTTLNKMCGSGMQAVILAHDRILAGSADVIIAGGQENMSAAPYLLAKARQGYRFGHGQLQDHMLLDGLEDAYDQGKPMGYFAEATATKYAHSRAQQDAFAIRSLQRAQAASANGAFSDEITPVSYTHKDKTTEIMLDECPKRGDVDKIPNLPPVFMENGTITAANASAIADGAAALLLMRASKARQLGLSPMAKILRHHVVASTPAWFTTAPVAAINGLLTALNWSVESVDLFEINEAFAVVSLHAIDACGLDPDKVNIHGGACALGHPIGATGARIIVTLLHALKQRGLQRGLAALCIGGGEATAIAVELFA